MSRLRILVLAPDCNPDSICGPLLSYCQAEALAQLHDVTLAMRSAGERAVRSRRAPFKTVEVIRLPWLEWFYQWCLLLIFKNNYHNRFLTAFSYPFAVSFEWNAWRRLRAQIKAGEFDVVLRLLPVTAVLPSPFAFFLRNGPIPFVIGPINGGLPWPSGFSQAANQKGWMDSARNLYRLAPFARSTYRDAAAIIAGSSHTYSEFASYRDKLFFLPENGVSLSLCSSSVSKSSAGSQLQLIFVGALIPLKACDLALRAAVPVLQKNLGHFTIVGDGPERDRLEHLVASLGIEKGVSFCGWLSHPETMQRLKSSDVLVFPSVRDFGGAVVFEALAAGVVPVVADFGGPGDIVNSEVGYKVSLTSEIDVVAQMEKILTELANHRDQVERLRRQGIAYVQERLTWDAKAQVVSRILEWVVRRGPRPDLPPPKMLHPEPVSRS